MINPTFDIKHDIWDGQNKKTLFIYLNEDVRIKIGSKKDLKIFMARMEDIQYEIEENYPNF